MKEKIHRDKGFYKAMFAIALPIALQNLISTSLNMVSTVMIGGLSEEKLELAAVGQSNQYFFLYSLLLFGINSGAAIFVSQFWGKRDVKNIRKVLGIAISTGAFAGLLFTIGAVLTPGLIMRIYAPDPAIAQLGVRYLRIIGFSYIITAISFSYGFSCRSVGKANIPMIVSAIALGTDTLLNYLMIYGKGGFPAMGVEGAAIATLIARVLELVLLVGIIYWRKEVLAGKISEMFELSREFIARFFKTTIPVILNEGLWALGINMYSIAYARIDSAAIPSVQIANTIQSLFMVVSFGIGNACAVMIGNKIGANEKKEAIHYANKFSVIAPATGALIGLAIFIFSPLVLTLFHATGEIYYSAKIILVIMSAFMAFKVFNIVMVVGILRSGGDTTYSLFVDTGSVWLVGVPLALAGTFLWHLPIHWVVLIVSFEEIIKASMGIPRIISKKWVRNVVENM